MPGIQHSLIKVVWEMKAAETTAFMFAALLVGFLLIVLHVLLRVAGLLSVAFPYH